MNSSYTLVEIVHSPFGWLLVAFLLFGAVQFYRKFYWFLRDHPKLGESSPEAALHCTVIAVIVIAALLAVPAIPLLPVIWYIGPLLLQLSAFFYLIAFIWSVVSLILLVGKAFVPKTGGSSVK